MNNTDPQPDHVSPDSESVDPSAAPSAEADESFVREVDRKFARVYSRSGLSVIAAVALFAGLSVTLFGTETLRMARLWIGLVLVFLVSLFVVRIFVARRALELLAKIQSYCLANDLQIKTLRADHTQNGAYQFFRSVFEVAERRNIAIDPPGDPAYEELPDPEADVEPSLEPSDEKETRSW